MAFSPFRDVRRYLQGQHPDPFRGSRKNEYQDIHYNPYINDLKRRIRLKDEEEALAQAERN